MSFPYLIISDANANAYKGMAPEVSGQKSAVSDLRSPTSDLRLVASDHPSLFKRPRGYHGWQHPHVPRNFKGSRPVTSIVPRSEWTARIQAGQGSFLSDLVKLRGVQAKDQGPLNYCWAYGSTRAAELWRLLVGKPLLDLSPESVGGPPSRWRNVGGYASEAFDQLESYGACQASFMDQPHSLRPRLWKTGWQQDALNTELPDWYDLEAGDASPIFDELISLLLSRTPVAAGLGWWGHLVCFLDPIILPPGVAPANTPDGATVGVLFQNSWGVDWPTPAANGLACLTEDLATPDGAAAPVAAGLPAWSK